MSQPLAQNNVSIHIMLHLHFVQSFVIDESLLSQFLFLKLENLNHEEHNSIATEVILI